MNYYYIFFGFPIVGILLYWLIKRAWRNVDADSCFRQSYNYAKNEDYDKAIEELTKVIRLNPRHVRAYNNRGSMWVKKGNYDKAITDFTEAIHLDPNDSYSYFNRGCTYFNTNEYDKAIADLTEAIRINPNDKDAYNYRGCSFRAKDEHGKAITDFTESIRIDPNEIFVYNNRAWLYATCPVKNYRNGKQSIEDAIKACELSSWKTSECIGTLAAANAESGDFENAIKWIKKAISMDDKLKDIRLDMLSLFEHNKPYRYRPVE